MNIPPSTPPLHQQTAPVSRGAAAPEHLELPVPGATFAQASRRYLRKWNTFHGRASRSEYWWAVLFVSLLTLIPILFIVAGNVVIAVVVGPDGGPVGWSEIPAASVLLSIGIVLSMLLGIGTIVPSLALAWRRLHDADFPGPFYFFSLIPSAGAIILLVLLLMPSKPEGRRFDLVR